MDNIYTHDIIPGILEKDWAEIEKKINLIKTFSNRIHIDFIDGKFAPNSTFLDPSPFLKYKDLYLEAHLMVEEPINYLDSLASSGFKKFLGHVEKMQSQEEFVAKAELLGETGLVIDLPTGVDSIEVPFEDLDCIMVMSVKAGESGQSFEESSIAKIGELRERTFIPIEVDGGITDLNLLKCKEAGANLFVSTSFISNSSNPALEYQKLKKLL